MFRLFAFVYGTLMLYRVHTVELPLKLTIILNTLVVWALSHGHTIDKK